MLMETIPATKQAYREGSPVAAEGTLSAVSLVCECY